jgi:LCP family protein required for cell wall assembly
MSSIPSPTIAAALSFVFPGLGQIYAGATRRGLLLAGPWTLLLIGVVYVLAANRVLDLVFHGSTATALLVFLVAVFFYHLAAMLDAYGQALRERQLSGAGQPRGSALVVAVLAAIMLVPYGVLEVYGISLNAGLDASFRGDNTRDNPFIPGFEPDPTDEPGLPTASPDPTVSTPDPTAPAGPSPSASPLEPSFGPIDAAWAENGRLDLLLIGADAGPGRSSVRTDTMILLSVEIESGKAAMFGFPRNIRDVPLPEESRDAYPGGRFPEMLSALWRRAAESPDRFRGSEGIGKECQHDWNCERAWRALAGALQRMAGVPIDGIVGVDLNGFALVVDSVGGVWIDVPARVVDDRYPRQDGTKIKIDIEPGCQKLDGTLALAYARSRHQDSDYQRMRRQQFVLQAIRRQFDPLAMVPKALELLTIFRDNVFTSIDRDDIPLLAQVAARVDADSIKQVRIQGPRFERSIGSEDLSRIRGQIQDVFEGDFPEPSPTPSGGKRCPAR